MDGYHLSLKIKYIMKNKDLAISSTNINKVYLKYDDRVIEFMRNIILDLEEDYSTIPLSFKVNFDLLANVLSLYYQALDGYKDADRPIDKQRYYTQIMLCTKQINSLCNGLGCDPLMKAKINKLNRKSAADEAEELLEALVN